MFYTYLWLRTDGTPYYAGKGKGRRGFINWGHSVPCPKDKERIITQEWLTENQAYEAEKFLIAYYGRLDEGTGCLRNRTNGGDGGATFGHKGHKHSAETKAAFSAARKGMPCKNKGSKRSVEQRARMAKAFTGRPKSPRTPEHCKKISDARKAYWKRRKSNGIQ